jgi:putative phage-type endonuclease
MEAYYVWREGLSDWVVNLQCPEFLALCKTPSFTPKLKPQPAAGKTMTELFGLCRGILADGKVTNAEVMLLNTWLQDVGFIAEWPASEIAQTLERILEDGKITKDEKAELKRLLERIIENPTQQPQTPTVDSKPTESNGFACLSIKLEQGTPEWVEWRHEGIGASDAPVVMNENPWKAASELLREKRGRPRPSIQNAAMARGTMLEPEARNRYISRIGEVVRPACFQSIRHPWQRASVDGITTDGSRIVEIKCGDSVYRKTALTRSVPDYYYGQLQHIMAVTGISAVDFFCYLPGCPEVLIQVQRDDRYIMRLIEAEIAFWEKMSAGR